MSALPFVDPERTNSAPAGLAPNGARRNLAGELGRRDARAAGFVDPRGEQARRLNGRGRRESVVGLFPGARIGLPGVNGRIAGLWWAAVLAGLLAVGCGREDAPPPNPRGVAANPSDGGVKSSAKTSPSTPPPKPRAPEPTPRRVGMFEEPGPSPPGPSSKGAQGKPGQRRSLADLLEGDAASLAETPDYLIDPHDGSGQYLPDLPRMSIDEKRVAAAGLRKLTGKHLTLYTDLPPGAEVDVLPAVFDQAFPQWCRYLGVDAVKNADWRLTGMLMKDKEPFRRAGLMPDGLPPFPHGYARNYEFWLYEQPSDYYRRHLLLHEGTHGFMNTLLGSCGPPWYMEGIAELLATHRWQDGRLQMNVFPSSREEAPMWGRVKIVQDCYAAKEGKYLEDVVHYSRRAHRQNDPYGWCWAAAAFLDGHPRYQKRFRELPKLVRNPDFSDRFFRMYADEWDAVSEEWEVFVADLQYGYDLGRNAIDFTPGKPLPERGTTVTVAAELGWQNSGLRLEAGRTYRLTAAGRYQVAARPQPWPCEPGGVTIRYWNGRPLGVLLAAVRPDKHAPPQPSALTRPMTVGLGTTVTPAESGTLFLRINDSPAELADNAGTLTVSVGPAPTRPGESPR